MASAGYSRAQIRLHWLVALLVLFQFLIHEGASQAFERGLEGKEFTLTGAAAAHFAGGAVILVLVALRLALRKERGARQGLAIWHNYLFLITYTLLLLQPVTGAIAWSMKSGFAGTVHSWLEIGLLALIVLHVALVLHGQYLRKTGVLLKMMRPDA